MRGIRTVVHALLLRFRMRSALRSQPTAQDLARSIRRSGLVAVAIACELLSAPAIAQDAVPIPKVGVIISPLARSPQEVGLRNGLRQLGYTEGRNIVLEWRQSVGDVEAMRSVAADLARANVGVIVTFSTPAARGALEATDKPVVFLTGDPVASGLATSLAKPGGRATGVSVVLVELVGKRLELLRQVAPKARRVAYLLNSSNPVGVLQLKEAQRAARTLGIELVPLDARNAGEIDAALHAIPASAVDAIQVSGDILFLTEQARIAQAIRKTRLPAMFASREYHEQDVLMSYGPSIIEAARRMATYVDRILKGARPGELPIEQVSKYELILNLRVARTQGIKVPRSLLMRADEVIR